MSDYHIDYYKENWRRSSKWLTENAPEYVIDCIKILAKWTVKTVKISEDIKKSINKGS